MSEHDHDAATRWRALPAEQRRRVRQWIWRGQATARPEDVAAFAALDALAREAEST
jgi:hypothetical protein